MDILQKVSVQCRISENASLGLSSLLFSDSISIPEFQSSLPTLVSLVMEPTRPCGFYKHHVNMRMLGCSESILPTNPSSTYKGT